MSPARGGAQVRLRLRVTATAESILRSGHPWLFAESIREQNRDGHTGELAVIYDRQDNFLAIGLFDAESPLRVRVLHAGKPQTIDEAWWRERFNTAVARRSGLFDAQTNGYRLINGESDGWPGLVLDRYDTTLVLKLYTAAWLPRWEELRTLIREALKPTRLVLRLSRNIQGAAKKDFGLADGQLMFGERIPQTDPRIEPLNLPLTRPSGTLSPAPSGGEGRGEEALQFRDRLDDGLVFLETGLRFEADVVRGQKTGFFLDQRENRRRVEALARGREVLNAFSYSGGFSIYAARGGAKSVTDLDISAHALVAARRNFALNQSHVAHCRHETIQADAFAWLEQNSSRQFDLVVLDPPSLARREVERTRAIEAYGRLVGHGIAVLRRDGVLVAASCSAHVSAPEFFEAVRQAARRSGRRFEELETTGHPPDHPATFAEAQYLKCVYMRCSS